MPIHVSAPLPPVVGLGAAAAAFSLPPDVRYVDTAAQGPRLARAVAAAHAAVDVGTAPWRLGLDAWRDEIEAVRSLVAVLAFEGDTAGVALVPSVAHGVATVAGLLPLEAGDAVVVLDGQFPSNLLPWQQRCAETGARIVPAVRAPDEDWTAAVLRTLGGTPRVRVLALPEAYWHDGSLLDLDAIAEDARALGAALVIDASQSLGVLPLSLATRRPDAVVSVGSKWLLGPPGLAWLWLAPQWRETGLPLDHHWEARDIPRDWRYDIANPPPHRPGARRFDAGGVTDPVTLAVARASLEQLQRWRLARILPRLARLTATLDAQLAAAGLAAWSTPGHAPHFTGLRPPADRIDAIHLALQRQGVICTHRHGCLRIAPYLHLAPRDMQRIVEIAATAAAV